MSGRGLAAVMAAVALGVAAAGCGSEDRSPRATIEEFQTAFATADFERACELVTPAAARHVGEAGHQLPTACPADMKLLALSFRRSRDERDAPQPQVRAVEVDGDRAVAVLALGAAARAHVPLARRDGEWRIDAVFGDLPAGRQRNPF